MRKAFWISGFLAASSAMSGDKADAGTPTAYDLPPAVFSVGGAPLKRKWRLVSLRQPTLEKGRTAPLVDQLFPADDRLRTSRDRSMLFAMAGTQVTIEGSRRKEAAWGPSGLRPIGKSFAAGITWAWGDALDHFALHVATLKGSIAQPDVLIGQRHFSDDRTDFGVSWLHDDRWSVDLGWRQSTGATRVGGLERAVEIASGAPLHETGPHLALGVTPWPSMADTRFGIEASMGRVAKDDLLVIGTQSLTDRRLGLFWRSKF